jgi:hypothetical protein
MFEVLLIIIAIPMAFFFIIIVLAIFSADNFVSNDKSENKYSNLRKHSAPLSERTLGVYDIEYGDHDGVITKRKISVTGVSATDVAVYVRAYCHLRDDERTFRAERMLEASKVGGSKISDPEIHFMDFVPANKRPDPEHDSVMKRVGSSLNCLIWIARADREITSDEAETLIAFINERNKISGTRASSMRWDANKAATFILDARPTLASASAAISRMSPAGRDYALIRTFSDKLVALGGAPSERRRSQLFRK